MTVQQPIDITSADQWKITAYRCTCHNIRWAFEPTGGMWRPNFGDVFETGPDVPKYATVAALSKEHTLHPVAVDNVEALLAADTENRRLFAEYVTKLHAALLDVERLTAENEQLRDKVERRGDELRDKGNDLLNVRGILSPNGRISPLPPEVEATLGVGGVAPAVEWLVAEVCALRAEVEAAAECHRCADRAGDAWRRIADALAERLRLHAGDATLYCAAGEDCPVCADRAALAAYERAAGGESP